MSTSVPQPALDPALGRFLDEATLLALNETSRVLIDGLLGEGLTLLYGEPKVGKSWLALQAARAVAEGTPFLGRESHGAHVLYYALEDSEPTLKDRITVQSMGSSLTRISYSVEWWSVTALERALTADPDVGLVVIDVLARVRPEPKEGVGAYWDDYNALLPFKRLADRFGVGIVLVHHTRKGGGRRAIEAANGTFGLVGIADGLWWLTKERLTVEGRRLRRINLDIRREERTCLWRLSASSSGANSGDGRRKSVDILAFLKGRKSTTPAEVAQQYGWRVDNTERLMRQMRSRGEIARLPGRSATYELRPSRGDRP